MLPELRDARMEGFNFDDPRGYGVMLAEAVRFQPDVILVDTFARVHKRDENSNTEIAALFGERIRPFLRECGEPALLFAHHTRKGSKEEHNSGALGDLLRGAGDIKGNLDQHWLLRAYGKDSVQVVHEKGRYGELEPFVLDRVDCDEDAVAVRYRAPDQGAKEDGIQRRAEKAMLQHLEISGQLSRKQLMAIGWGAGAAERTCELAISLLRAEGRIREQKRGREKLYFLCSELEE
jgi:hypothetical protein